MPMSYHVNIKTNFLNQIQSGVGVVRAFYELPSNLKLKKEMKKKNDSQDQKRGPLGLFKCGDF